MFILIFLVEDLFTRARQGTSDIFFIFLNDKRVDSNVPHVTIWRTTTTVWGVFVLHSNNVKN